MKKRGIVFSVIFSIFGALIAIAGVVSLLLTLKASDDLVSAEFDDHLEDIVALVDHSISGILAEHRNNLLTMTNSPHVNEAEADFVMTGNTAPIIDAVRHSAAYTSGLTDAILVLQGGKVLACTEALNDYTILSLREDDDLLFCLGGDGEYYLALVAPSVSGGLTYAALIGLESFYRSAVPDDIYDTYWTVLYDERNNLALGNEHDTPDYKVKTAAAFLSRDDGYSALVRHEQTSTSGADTYSYNPGGSEEPAYCRMYSLCSADAENDSFAVGVSISNDLILVPMHRTAVQSLLSVTAIGVGLFLMVFLLLHSGKSRREMEVHLAALEKENRLSASLLEKQKEIIHHQRLETIGQLTAGIAHEFNNLLTPIMGNSMLLLEKLPPEDTESFDNTVGIYEASVKAKNLVSRISRLSRKPTGQTLQPLSLNELVSGVTAMATPAQPKNVQTELELKSNHTIMADRVQLGHAILNLMLNGYQAMTPGGGTLTVSTEDKPDGVVLTVADTGCGIPPEVQARIFEPFFTTKESGKGTGLGLSIVQKTLQEHGAEISVTSIPGHGSQFILFFPLKPSE